VQRYSTSLNGVADLASHKLGLTSYYIQDIAWPCLRWHNQPRPVFETFRGLGIFSRYTGIDLVDQWVRNRTRLPSAALLRQTL